MQYLNDLENNPRYKRWNSDLQEFLRPVFPGQLRYVARNTFSAVFFLDIQERESIDITLELFRLIDNNTPVRFGIVFYSPMLASGPAQWDYSKPFLQSRFAIPASDAAKMPSVMLLRAFSFISSENDREEATSWLQKTLKDVPSGQSLTIDHVAKAFKSKMSEKDWVSLVSSWIDHLNPNAF